MTNLIFKMINTIKINKVLQEMVKTCDDTTKKLKF